MGRRRLQRPLSLRNCLPTCKKNPPPPVFSTGGGGFVYSGHHYSRIRAWTDSSDPRTFRAQSLPTLTMRNCAPPPHMLRGRGTFRRLGDHSWQSSPTSTAYSRLIVLFAHAAAALCKEAGIWRSRALASLDQ